jgi:hypothetical protein
MAYRETITPQNNVKVEEGEGNNYVLVGYYNPDAPFVVTSFKKLAFYLIEKKGYKLHQVLVAEKTKFFYVLVR